MRTLAFHEHAALLLQTGGVNEETEVVSLGTEQVPDVALGHREFQWLLSNLLKDLPGALPGFLFGLPPGFLQSLLQSTAKKAESSTVVEICGERTSLLIPASMQALELGLLEPWQRSCRRFQLWEGASPGSGAW